MRKYGKKYGLKESMHRHLYDNQAIYLFTIVLFLVGIVFGAIVVNSLSITQKHDLYMYLQQFFGQVSDGHVATSTEMFKQSFSHYAKYFGLMWILGLSIIGLPVILVLLFLKGVVIGFTVGFLVSQMGMNGFFLSFVSVLPQNLILVPAFIIIGTASVSFCLKMIRNQFVKGINEPFFPQFLQYSMLILCVGASSLIASGIEAYMSPLLMRMVIGSIL
ncbi:stage II sporulation protein M [Halalkalibacterium halodurans]|uniref:Stage II sporulation protein M n=1 Tax=Halalkalibacterium halodurans (strain ATCC BAA-125 / DSM 18197 / FERM 7344 / JCM 9153 / C-125) TaxID=272558 RepID=Q9KCP3_HALH5|nr:stage II sporulation protein M [Halalkalibacterium halodurans]MED4164580.1 stage II sporulation protein M [Halalkalibacterium halodurans]BAB05245.1 stage II sporulation protein M [Halalkalibacterium halodurans C-125]